MGDTLEECRRNIAEAVAGHISVLRELGRTVPQPSAITDLVDVA
jgi:predicted RNase H-like HicB family nuclease